MIPALKVTLRDRMTLFWTFFYPLMLVVILLSIVRNATDTDTFTLSVDPRHPISRYLEAYAAQGQLSIEHASSEEEAFDHPEVDGFLDRNGHLIVRKSGVASMVLSQVVNTTLQYGQLASEGYDVPSFDAPWMSASSTGADSRDAFSAFYLSNILAMMSFYGAYSAIGTLQNTQANMSPLGARIAASSASRFRQFLLEMAVGIGICMAAVILAVGVAKCLFPGSYFGSPIKSLFLVLIGLVCSFSLGICFTYFPRISISAATIILNIIMLTLAFPAGLMGDGIRKLMDTTLPLFQKLNPLRMITDELMKLNVLNITDTYWRTLGILSIIALVFTAIAAFGIRRSRYDAL